jgi:hypothetical protein
MCCLCWWKNLLHALWILILAGIIIIEVSYCHNSLITISYERLGAQRRCYWFYFFDNWLPCLDKGALYQVGCLIIFVSRTSQSYHSFHSFWAIYHYKKEKQTRFSSCHSLLLLLEPTCVHVEKGLFLVTLQNPMHPATSTHLSSTTEASANIIWWGLPIHLHKNVNLHQESSTSKEPPSWSSSAVPSSEG